MKLQKIVMALAVACLGLLVPAANAEYYTSFAAPEGYTDGDINGQLGWVYTGGETGKMNVYTTRAGVDGNGRGEETSRSTYSNYFDAVTGDAYFTIYYSTAGYRGIQLSVGDVDPTEINSTAFAALFFATRNYPDGCIHYQVDNLGTMHTGPLLPTAAGSWWGIRADLHWNAETSRYTSWDFKYAEVGDSDWTTVETGLGFRSSDADGFNHNLTSIMLWNRGVTADPRGTILVDHIYVGNDAPALLSAFVPKPGDANSDGFVSEADAAILAGNWLKTGMGWSDGNFNDDDVVDDKDATIMATNWSGAGANNVPEPGIVIMLSALGLALAAMRRWR